MRIVNYFAIIVVAFAFYFGAKIVVAPHATATANSTLDESNRSPANDDTYSFGDEHVLAK
jgi:hypothetical protein